MQTTMALALLLPVLLLRFDEPYFARLNATELFTLVSGIVPAVTRVSRISPFPEYVKATECIEWMFVPLYFLLWLMAMPFWSERIVNIFRMKFVVRNNQIQWAVVIGLVFIALMICSDLFRLRYLSIFTGFGLNDHLEGRLGSLMNGQRGGFALVAWVLCVCESYMYYLMLALSYVGWLRIKRASALAR